MKKVSRTHAFMSVVSTVISGGKNSIHVQELITSLMSDLSITQDQAISLIKNLVEADFLTVRKSKSNRKFISVTKKACNKVRMLNKNKKQQSPKCSHCKSEVTQQQVEQGSLCDKCNVVLHA